MGIGRGTARGRLARDGTARTYAGHCREAAEVDGQAAQGPRDPGSAAANCRARKPPARATLNALSVLTRFLAQISLRNLRKLDCYANRCPLRSKTLQEASKSLIYRHGQMRPMMVHRAHAETNLRLVHRRRRQALRALDSGGRGLRRKFLLSGAPRYHAVADVAGAAEAGMVVRRHLHDRFGSRRPARICDRRAAL